MSAAADALMGIFGFNRVESEMKTVEETRRELFEGKFPPPYYISWNADPACYYSIHRDFTRKRHAERYEAKWQGFNAALDAVVIELPRLRAYPPNEASSDVDYWIDEAKWDTWSDCRAAIESTNLGIKVK